MGFGVVEPDDTDEDVERDILFFCDSFSSRRNLARRLENHT